MTKPIPVFMIFSREHNAWWRGARRGYTRNPMEAGLYQPDEAMAIVYEANRYRTVEEGPAEFCYPCPPHNLLAPSHLAEQLTEPFVITVNDPRDPSNN